MLNWSFNFSTFASPGFARFLGWFLQRRQGLSEKTLWARASDPMVPEVGSVPQRPFGHCLFASQILAKTMGTGLVDSISWSWWRLNSCGHKILNHRFKWIRKLEKQLIKRPRCIIEAMLCIHHWAQIRATIATCNSRKPKDVTACMRSDTVKDVIAYSYVATCYISTTWSFIVTRIFWGTHGYTLFWGLWLCDVM